MRLNLTWSPSITNTPRQQRRPLASSTPLSLSLSQPIPRKLRSLSLSQPIPRKLRSLSLTHTHTQPMPRQLRFLC